MKLSWLTLPLSGWTLSAILAVIVLASLTAYRVGRADGRVFERAKHDSSTIVELRAIISAAREAANHAADASREMRATTEQRVSQDALTTRELRHALAQTAAQRTACRLDAHSLQLITASRDRAAATAAAGLRNAVPGAAGASRR